MRGRNIKCIGYGEDNVNACVRLAALNIAKITRIDASHIRQLKLG